MKNIDIKSIIIGVLLTSTIFLGVAATSPTDKWDNDQKWRVQEVAGNPGAGWEPIGGVRVSGQGFLSSAKVLWRKRDQ